MYIHQKGINVVLSSLLWLISLYSYSYILKKKIHLIKGVILKKINYTLDVCIYIRNGTHQPETHYPKIMSRKKFICDIKIHFCM